MASTGMWKYKLQVEGSRKEHKAINANKVKTAFANMFGGNQAVAFA